LQEGFKHELHAAVNVSSADEAPIPALASFSQPTFDFIGQSAL